MSPEQITDLIRMTIFVALKISAPILVITLVLGLSISIFQSVTQIMESTLILVPKLIMTALTLSLTFAWVLKVIIQFTHEVFVDYWNQVLLMGNL